MDWFKTKQGKKLVKIAMRTKKKRIKKKMRKALFGDLFDY